MYLPICGFVTGQTMLTTDTPHCVEQKGTFKILNNKYLITVELSLRPKENPNN